jgi:hypothetical protein
MDARGTENWERKTTQGVEKRMYRFSRSIYRELAPRVVEDDWDPTRCHHKQKVLEACEGAIRRLACDRRYFARPARRLFNDVRTYFSMQDQLYVWHVIDSNMRLATAFLEQLPEGVGLDGQQPQCHAHTRKGKPCQRTPLPGRDYCPSHKHLEETFESAEIPEPAGETLDRELSSLAAA